MIMDLLLGCSHKRYSFPISSRAKRQKPAAALATGMYVVCLDCGKEFTYDWHQMRILSPRRAARFHAAAHAVEQPARSFATK